MKTKMQMRAVVLAAVAACCYAAAGSAQMAEGPKPKIAPGTMIDPSKTFDAMLSSFQEEFVGAAKAMPADRYDFAPSAKIFAPGQKTEYTGVRSFGGEVTHVAQANYYYASTFGHLSPDTDVEAIGKLKDKDKILAALDASFVFAHKAVANLTEKNAFESMRDMQTRASLAGGIVAHGFDHYGQMVEYLRMNGITPPASAK